MILDSDNMNEENEVERLMMELNNIRNKKIEEKEYYKVIMDVSYYDLSYSYNSSIQLKIPKFYVEEGCNSFGNYFYVPKKNMVNKLFGIYAVKDEYGIREMVTGLPLNTFTGNYLFCCGIKNFDYKYQATIGRDLQILNNDKRLKKEYVKKLEEMSKYQYDKFQSYCIEKKRIQQQENQAIQYLKRYETPRN